METASLSPSTVSTGSFSSTIPGIGMIAGRGIKRVGQTIIHFAEEPIVWYRLKTIERHFRDWTLGSAVFCDSQVLYCAIVDLVELLKPGQSITGHSLIGYPERINRRAAALYQEIHNYIINIGPGSFREDTINEVLPCCCRTYWFFKKTSRRLELEDQIVQIGILLDGIRKMRPRRRLKQETTAQTREVLCDFAASFTQILDSWDLHSFIAAHAVFKAFSFKSPCSRVEYRRLFEDGFLKVMAWLSEGNLPRWEDVPGYYKRLMDIFTPLVVTSAEFQVHLGSLMCAYTYAHSKIPRTGYFRFLASLSYPFECYRTTLPRVEIISQLNVDFIHKIMLELITSDYRRACPFPSSTHMEHEEYWFVRMAIKCLEYLENDMTTQPLLWRQHPMYLDIPGIVEWIAGPGGIETLDPWYDRFGCLNKWDLLAPVPVEQISPKAYWDGW